MLSFEQDLAAYRASTGLACPQNGSDVHSGLTPAKDRGENGDYDAFVQRILAAYARRVATGDPEDLAVMLACRGVMDKAIAAAVVGGRATRGWTWAEVGRVAELTRQGACKRWGGA